MKTAVLLGCLLALATACQVKDLRVQSNCLIEENGLIFDLCKLSNSTNDYELPYKQGDQDRLLTFNFFRNLETECENAGSYAATWWKEGEDQKCASHSMP